MISEYIARSIHYRVLTAFDEGVTHARVPPGRQQHLHVEVSDKHFSVVAPIAAEDDLVNAVRQQARDLCQGVERQVTTFISDTEIAVLVTDVVPTTLGVCQFTEGNVRWRLADRRQI